MQDISEDTEWNDILRKKGIIPEKEPEVSEQALTEMIEQTIAEKNSIDARLGHLNLEELDEQEDEEDERIILEFRRRRLEEMRKDEQLNKFGGVVEMSGVDYIAEVNNAGPGIWVYLHLYKPGIPLCSLINQHFCALASKFPKAKFIKSISTTCIANYPDKNLPAIFVYFEGKVKEQIIGEFKESLTFNTLEWRLSRTGGIKTTQEKCPLDSKPRDVLMGELGVGRRDNSSSDEDDW